MALVTTRILNSAIRDAIQTQHPRRLTPSDRGLDYDYVFVGAKKVSVPARTTNFLKIMLDGSGCSWVAAMPETQDEDAEVRDVTKNRIYLTGNMP